MTSDLRLLLRQLHVVEDAEDDPEEVVPPVLLEGVAVALHDLEHDGEASVGKHVHRYQRVPVKQSDGSTIALRRRFHPKRRTTQEQEFKLEGKLERVRIVISCKCCHLVAEEVSGFLFKYNMTTTNTINNSTSESTI